MTSNNIGHFQIPNIDLQMQLQICLISSLLSICSAQQVPSEYSSVLSLLHCKTLRWMCKRQPPLLSLDWLGRVFHNPFRIDVIRRNPVPPPAAPTQHRTAPATSPCPVWVMTDQKYISVLTKVLVINHLLIILNLLDFSAIL